MDITVAIVEDQQDTRKMLRQLIDTSKGVKWIDEYENGEDALFGLQFSKPDVVLMDINLPGKSGIECVKELKLLIPQTEFIMCTLIEDSDAVYNALKAGANGYLSKSSPPVKILEAITEIHHGGSPMSNNIARKVVLFFQNEEKKVTEFQKLTPREQEILVLLSKGYRYKEIAGMLFVSIETIRKHIHNIYQKLQVNSRTDAINKTF